MESKATLNAGDVCLDCQQVGLEKYLRYFKINLNGDSLLKCESNQCMYPHNDEFSSSDDEDNSIGNISQTNSLKLINDLIQQFDCEEKGQDTLNHVPIGASEQITQFDITFLDDFHAGHKDTKCKSEIVDDKNDYLSLLEAKPVKYDMSCKISNDDKSLQKFQLPELHIYDGNLKNCFGSYEMSSNTNIDIKEKITIQSIETLKNENSLYHELPTTSKNLLISNEKSAAPTAQENQQKSVSRPILKKLKDHINKNRLKAQTKTINSTNVTTSTLPNTNKKTPKKYQSSDIPKADILKANAVLRKLATLEEDDQTPKFNRKYKSARIQQKAKKPKPPSSSLNIDSNYTFDKITQMLLAKK